MCCIFSGRLTFFVFDAIAVSSFHLRSINFLINCILLKKLFMRSDIMDLTVIQDQDPIRMDHRRNSLCNDDFCHIAKFFQLFADLLFRRRIDCTGRIIKDQDLRIGKKCSCDTESLLLSSRKTKS